MFQKLYRMFRQLTTKVFTFLEFVLARKIFQSEVSENIFILSIQNKMCKTCVFLQLLVMYATVIVKSVKSTCFISTINGKKCFKIFILYWNNDKKFICFYVHILLLKQQKPKTCFFWLFLIRNMLKYVQKVKNIGKNGF